MLQQRLAEADIQIQSRRHKQESGGDTTQQQKQSEHNSEEQKLSDNVNDSNSNTSIDNVAPRRKLLSSELKRQIEGMYQQS